MVAPNVPPPMMTPQFAPPPPVPKALVTLTTVGAALAALFWGGIAAFTMLGLSSNVKIDPARGLVLPLVLVVLYAIRAAAVYRGNTSAVSRLIVLHLVGAAGAVFQLSTIPSALPADVIHTLQIMFGVKLAINVFAVIPTIMLANAQKWTKRY